MPKLRNAIGWFIVVGSVLLEAAEHVDFISSHLPRELRAAINEPVILVAVVVGFALLFATRARRESEAKSAERLRITSQPIPQAIGRLSHNMRFTGAKYLRSADGATGVVVACFQNKPVPHTPLKTFHSARVTVTFSQESGAAIGEVAPTAWTDTDSPTVDFEAGVTHCAAVAAFTPSGRWVACRIGAQETYWGDVAYSIEQPPLPAGILKAAVVLIGEMNLSLPAEHLILTLASGGSATVEVD